VIPLSAESSGRHSNEEIVELLGLGRPVRAWCQKYPTTNPAKRPTVLCPWFVFTLVDRAFNVFPASFKTFKDSAIKIEHVACSGQRCKTSFRKTSTKKRGGSQPGHGTPADGQLNETNPSLKIVADAHLFDSMRSHSSLPRNLLSTFPSYRISLASLAACRSNFPSRMSS